MATTLKIKSTTTVGKTPTTSDIQVAELALNLADQKLYSRNSTGIFEIGKSANVSGGSALPASGTEAGDLFYLDTTSQLFYWDGSAWVAITAELELGELTNVDTTGAIDGQVLVLNSGAWQPVAPSSLTISVDLGYTAAADKGTITNTAGTSAEIALGNGTVAGLSLNDYTTTEKDKLAAIDLTNYLQSGDNVSDLVNDANYITLADVPNDFVKIDDGGAKQDITGGGGLGVAGGITSEFGTSGTQLGNVAPLNDWSCYPARV